MKTDVLIIGGGVVGCSVARFLSFYDIKVMLVDKEEDVCSGTSKANSAIVHAGFDASFGSLKQKFNIAGSKMMEELSKELDFPYKRNGSMVLCKYKEDEPQLRKVYENGIKGGVEGLKLLTADEARAIEPGLTDELYMALLAESGAIVCPFGLTIAMAENAAANGAEFIMDCKVEDIIKQEDGYLVKTGKGDILTRVVVNAAGVYADAIHNMVSDNKLHITARKGEYKLMDKEAGDHVSHTIFLLPGKMGKGVLVSPTVHGNLLAGPTADDVDDKEETATHAGSLEELTAKASDLVKDIPFYNTITSFSGLRAHEEGGDFVVGECDDAAGFFDAAGIESPGLTAAPAIGEYLAAKIAEYLGAGQKDNLIRKRRAIPSPSEMSPDERAEYIRSNPSYGAIVCRCEGISEGEIREAIRRKPGAVSMDGVKRRVRAGMGRCQAGFCTPRTMEILAEELGIDMTSVCKNRKGSELIKAE
ncbi:NAD(P)/FAD-dependent oxidoreductase [Butyrivibrio sp. MC2013]|uniref:NAD(P)/FAD-dependent oxidoreductase n=1 Tax=Butyrivibrio sp. MC2013 TaxID=1280686 RepID=UPI0003F68EC5|nr:NAD(P)/FAD-dependent oxidoreductase [Butyrivibrio sp. MC2013]